MPADLGKLTLAVDSIGGTSIRAFFYVTADGRDTVLADGYFNGAKKRGLSTNDLIYVADITNPGTTYDLRVETANDNSVVVKDAVKGDTAFLDYASQSETRAGADVDKPVKPPEFVDGVDYLRPLTELDPRSMDATGSGLVDETAILQAAINTGRPIVIADGLTYLCGKLTCLPDTRIFGRGGTIKAKTGIAGALIYCNNPTTLSVRDVVLNCDGKATYGVYVEGSSGVDVDVRTNKILSPTVDGVYIKQGKNSWVDDNYIETPGRHGVTFDTGAEEFTSNGNIIKNPGGAGVIFSNASKNGSISNNVIDSPGVTGDGITGYHQDNENITIADNVITNSENHGIHVGGHRLTVTGNVCDGAPSNDGILIKATDTGSSGGATAASTDVVVANNSIDGAGRCSIELISTSKSVVGSNTCNGSADHQILLVESDNNVVNGNKCDSGAAGGVVLRGSKRNLVSSNKTKSHAGDAFRTENSSAITSTGNVIALNVSDTDNRCFIEATGSDSNIWHLNTPIAPVSTTQARVGTSSLFNNTPLFATLVYDPPSLTTGTGATTTVTVTGAAVGDLVEVSFSVALSDVLLSAWVSAADTVSVRFYNSSGGTRDLSNGTIVVRVKKIS